VAEHSATDGRSATALVRPDDVIEVARRDAEARRGGHDYAIWDHQSGN
jgi:hypothetical protein